MGDSSAARGQFLYPLEDDRVQTRRAGRAAEDEDAARRVVREASRGLNDRAAQGVARHEPVRTGRHERRGSLPGEADARGAAGQMEVRLARPGVLLEENRRQPGARCDVDRRERRIPAQAHHRRDAFGPDEPPRREVSARERLDEAKRSRERPRQRRGGQLPVRHRLLPEDLRLERPSGAPKLHSRRGVETEDRPRHRHPRVEVPPGLPSCEHHEHYTTCVSTGAPSAAGPAE